LGQYRYEITYTGEEVLDVYIEAMENLPPNTEIGGEGGGNTQTTLMHIEAYSSADKGIYFFIGDPQESRQFEVKIFHLFFL